MSALHRKWLSSLLGHCLIIVAAVCIGFPFFYMVTTSLKGIDEVYSVPLKWLPSRPMWENYLTAWNGVPFARFTLNTLIFTIVLVVTKFLCGLSCGFAFARINFPKKDFLFYFILLVFMIPSQLTLIPRFVMLKQLDWINTYQGLIAPEMASVFATFLLREHFRSLPDELFDAAKVDGAGYFRQMMQIALPISRPIVVTLLLLDFVAHWNEYLWPLIVTNTASMRTLPIGIQSLKYLSGELPQWHIVMAGATMVVLPLMILFLLGQKQFIEGATQGALKG